jgi:hypothetical protein
MPAGIDYVSFGFNRVQQHITIKSVGRHRCVPAFNDLVKVIVFLLLLFSTPVFASETVLDDVRVTAEDGMTTIDIDLGLPLGYVKHFPQTFGEILQIQLLLDKNKDRRIHKEVRQGSDIKPPPGHEPLLVYVTYEEGVPGGPYLTLRFAHPVRFEVLAGSSLTTLTVKIHEAKKLAAKEKLQLEDNKGEPADALRAQKQKKQKSEDDELMAKARQALTFGDNTGAIELLRKIIAIPDSPHAQDARELLGLALERSNQIPRAKFEYKKYLTLYKEGEGPNRVRQRLVALQNIGLERRKRLRPTRRRSREDRFRTFGRLSQAFSSRFLQRAPQTDDDRVQSEDLVLTRFVTSNINVRGRYRGESYNLQTVFSANHTYDERGNNNISTQGNTVENDTESRVTELYVDYDDFKMGLKASAGRQRSRNSGIFSRFDGVVGGYAFTPEIAAYAFTGKPVSFYNVDFDKTFYGMRLDYGKRKAALTGNLYYITQDVSGVGDREAVGGLVRYADKETTMFALVDYDILFNELTLANLRWGWKFDESSKVSVSYNYRFLLFASTAINSQPVGFNTIPYLSSQLTDDQILQMARERTTKSDTITLGYSYEFDKERQFNVDYSVFGTEGTKTTSPELVVGNLVSVQGFEGSSNQYSLSAQYIASNMFEERDLHVAGMRYSNFDTYKETTLFVNSRLPPMSGWRFRPRLSVGQRTFQGSNITQGKRLSLAPSLTVDYRWEKRWVFDATLGFEWVRYDDPLYANETRQDIRIGYNYTF